MIKKTYAIPDMHCANCVMRLEGIEDELEGILRVKGSYHKQTLEVEYDEAQVGEAQIRAAIEEMGFTVGEAA